MSEMNNPFETNMFPHCNWRPIDPTVNEYRFLGVGMAPSQYNDWRVEGVAAKKTCSFFAQLEESQSGFVTGPDVIKLLSDCTTNSHAKFPVGKSKHSMITDDNGNIIMHGLALRYAEDKVWLSTLYPWIVAATRGGNYDVTLEETTTTRFIFQLSGPKSLEIIEAAAEKDLHDIPFLGFKETTMLGKPVTVLRMTMCGTLGYEVHGNAEDAMELHEHICSVGEEFGIKKIGWLGYYTNNTEAGMPQEAVTFVTSAVENEFYLEGLRAQGMDTDIWPCNPRLRGSSSERNNVREYFRNPIELNWDISVSFDHDFPGKAALMELKANPKRKSVTLVWNQEDILDIVASYYREDEEPYRWLDHPVACYHQADGIEQDDVYSKDGKQIGYSSLVSYSIISKKMLSMAIVDVDYLAPGTEVEVLWGEPGDRKKKIRATVAEYPYLKMPSKKDFDINSIPRRYK